MGVKREFDLIEFDNGNVWVSDKEGNQIPSLQKKSEWIRSLMDELESNIKEGD